MFLKELGPWLTYLVPNRVKPLAEHRWSPASCGIRAQGLRDGGGQGGWTPGPLQLAPVKSPPLVGPLSLNSQWVKDEQTPPGRGAPALRQGLALLPVG